MSGSVERKVNVAVVGVGYWGPNLVRNLAASPEFDVRYVCDQSLSQLEMIAARYPAVTVTADYAEVLESDVEAVVIATPVSTHHPLALRALESGKHTFVEKPLAASGAEAEELVELAATRGLVLMPGHTFLYSPPVRMIKSLLDERSLGDVYFITSSRVNLGLHQSDVSVVWDLGPHDLSILRYWLGTSPSEVSALSRSCVLPGIPDVCFMNLQYATGAVAHVELSWLSPTKLRRTAIVGSERMLVYDDTSNEPVRIFDSGANLPDPETFGQYKLSYRTGDIVSPRVDAVEPLSLELADFGHAIRQGDIPVSSAQLGLEVVRTLEAVDEALARRQPVGVPGAAPLSIEETLQARLSTIKHAVDAERDDDEFSADASIGTAILGGGPAGLTAATMLARRGAPGAVFEADGAVGGIAKTVVFDGYRFDLGGHRFFTKLAPVRRLWEEMLGEDFLTRPRLSRIYYNGKYFAYPITAKDVVGRLGLGEATLCALSYLRARTRARAEADTFEEWVTARFGRRLYDAFFKSYTQKLWGIPGTEIRSLWAAQRIKNFSLGKAILDVLGIRREHVTTLIEKFDYPRLGPGQMWEAFAAHAAEGGIPVHLNHRAAAIKHDGHRVTSIVVRSNGDTFEYDVDSVVSSIPLRELVLSLTPAAPPHVQEAARKLRYRDLVLVALMTTEEEPFPDNWIYLHDPETRAGRVQNYGAWSDDMVKPGTTCLGVEYFCFREDDIWTMPDQEAVELAKQELARIGLIDPSKVIDGVKVLVPKAYPMYDREYEDAVMTIRRYLARFENLQTCGRNGLHRYNNQDHSMWTALLATLNVLDGADHDVWDVNTDDEYHEEGELAESAIGFGVSRPARAG